ncbi:hypothetical protein V2J09_000100 [Rumex salicifolius]
MASSLLNGERFVVFLFVARILVSIPPSLISESVSLLLLSLFALFVEISADSSNDRLIGRFKIRPGASSGILLGAITLPAVMVSKLIKLSRGLSLQEIQLEDFEYQKALCSATFISCFGVLLLLYRLTWCTRNKLFLPHYFWILMTTVTVNYLVKDLPSTLKLLWMLGHSIATVTLLQHVFHLFPSCASIGEALLVTNGLVIYAGDMLRSTIIKGSWISTEVNIGFKVVRSEISTIIQGMLLGLLVFPLFFKLSLKVLNHFKSPSCYGTGECNDIGKSIIFFGSLVLKVVVIIPLWVQVLTFVFSEPLKRLSLCAYWMIVTYVSVRRFYHISKNSKIERILLRKYYHLMAVLMFVPALIFQPMFLQLAFGAALAVFLLMEIIRVWRIWPLGDSIHQFMNAFTDHRDSDLLIVSHFSLLLGCALPMWMSSGYNDRPLAPFAGILSLGIGDTMASMVGYKYGVLRWSKSGKKTIEGTAAGITSVLLACSVLIPLLASTGYVLNQDWSSLLFAVSLAGLLEAYTAQLDNAFIPLVFYSLLCL